MLEVQQENSSNRCIANTNIRASLRMMGTDFDVEEVTEILGMTPSETWKKGDYIRNTKRKRTYTAWIYNTGIIESLDIKGSAKQIKEMFFPKINQLVKLKSLYNLDISIDFVIIIERDEPPSIYFDPEFIQFASRIGAGFDIDTYIN